MRELKSGPALTPLADLDTQRSFSPSGNREGYFSARYFAVTAFVWFGVFAVAGSLWYTAFALGAVVAGYFR